MCQVSLNKNISLLQIKTNIFNICFNAYRTIANNINTQILYHEYVTLYDLRQSFPVPLITHCYKVNVHIFILIFQLHFIKCTFSHVLFFS